MAITGDSVSITTTTKKKKKHRSNSSCFLGCFGLSSPTRPVPATSTHDEDDRKKIAWSRFHLRRTKSAVKTVPVDVSAVPAPEKINNPTKEIHVVKSSYKKSFKTTQQQEIHGTKQTKSDKAQEIILEDSKRLDYSNSAKEEEACQKGQRKTTRRSSSYQHLERPAEVDKHEINSRGGGRAAKTAASLTHSASLPPPQRRKEAAASTTKKKHSRGKYNSKAVAGTFDSLVGLSIIGVTLIIMLLWGKLCAILCTSAWFYFVPRFRAHENSAIATATFKNESTNSGELDSEKYKKKVVFEGFLERNHRSVIY